jgi:hypothetical protein
MRDTEDMTDYELDATEEQAFRVCGCGNSQTETMVLMWSGMEYRRFDE